MIAMDRNSIDDTGKTTKARLLDAAEKLYTKSGQENLSLRDLTELAGVNLAAVNYHFGSKNALVCAMIARRFDFVCEARLGDLSRFERELGDKLRCEHVFIAILKVLIDPGFDVITSPEPRRFAIRASGDLSQPLRQFLTQRYSHVEQRFLAAFSRVTPWMKAEEVAWKINCLAFALPGTGLNASTYQLIRKALDERSMTPMDVFASLSATVSALLNAPPLDTDHLTLVHTIFASHVPLAA
jgi:AcrR family transcriptional regulator